MKLPKYLITNNKSELASQIIISTVRPFAAAYVLVFTNRDDYASALANNTFLKYVVVDNYMIIIVFNGNLDGKIEIGDLEKWKQQTDVILEEMKQFYITERIEPSKRFYNKYLK